MITLPVGAVLAAAVLATSFLSGLLGMAGGMILMGVFLHFIPVAPAMVLHGVTQSVANGWRGWLWRQGIAWRILRQYAVGAIVTALTLTVIRFTPDKAIGLIILSLLPVIGLALPARLAPDLGQSGHAYLCGVVCTALMLTCGVSGPLFDVFFVRSDLDRKQVIATKAAIQVFGHLLKVAFFAPALIGTGLSLPPAVLVMSVVLALAGTQLSKRFLDAASDAQFRFWSRVVIVGLALVYLFQGVYLLFLDYGLPRPAPAA